MHLPLLVYYLGVSNLYIPTSIPTLSEVSKTGGLYTTVDPLNFLKISSKHSKIGRQCKNPNFWLFFQVKKNQYTGNIGLTFPHDKR